MKRNSIVLFGASTLGLSAYYALRNDYNIYAFCDNDMGKWGTEIIDGIKVMPPEELIRIEDIKVVITSMYYSEISKQLSKMGIDNYQIYETGLYESKNPVLDLWNKDEEFQQLFNSIEKNVVADKIRCYMLYEYIKNCIHLEGNVAEVGVYKGGTAKLIAKIFEPVNKEIYLFDTFSGMPESDLSIDLHEKGDFSDTSEEGVKAFLQDCKNVHTVKGFFPESGGIIKDMNFSFVHIDVDIYKSIKDCCAFFYDRMCPGGIMIFDDFGLESCPGVKKAVDEFFIDKKEYPIFLPSAQGVVIKI